MNPLRLLRTLIRSVFAGIYLFILRKALGVAKPTADEARRMRRGLADRSLSRFEIARSFVLAKDFPGLKYGLHELLFDSQEIYDSESFAEFVKAKPYTEEQLVELVNPRKWLNPEWYGVLADMHVIPPQLELMHRKAFEWVQTIYGLKRLGHLRPEARCLDVGAGHEALAYYLANHVAEVVATDLYEDDWAQAGAREGAADVLEDPAKYAPFEYRKEHLRFMRMDGRKLEFDSDSFDFVVSLSSIEHFGGVAAAADSMREMGRVCKPGGLLAVATELIINDATHDEFFSLAELRELVAASGLKLIQRPVFRLPRALRDAPTVLPDEFFRAPMLVLSDQDVRFTSILLFLEKE